MSTKIFSELGYNLDGKPSTRVHAPPGGGSSFSIGGGYEEPTTTPRNKASPAASPIAQTAATPAAVSAHEFPTLKLSLLESIAAARDMNALIHALQAVNSKVGAPAPKQAWAAQDSSTPAVANNGTAQGNQPGDSRTQAGAPAATGVEASLQKLRDSLKSRGARGIVGLGKKFKIMDDDGSNQISFPEFKKCMAEHTLNFTEQELRELFKYFDQDCSGEIGYDEFLTGIRGELNERRKKFVEMAFKIMDTDGSGTLELADIMTRYDASKHPDVIAGKRSASEILREFLDTFDGGEKDGKVDFGEFCRYYSNVSASIDDDDYFELMMRNAWHISGGEGWCANTTNRRVLVTHADGRQSVEEIKNDINISSTNTTAMRENLKNQGISAKDMAMHYANDDTQSPKKSARYRGAGPSSITFG